MKFGRAISLAIVSVAAWVVWTGWGADDLVPTLFDESRADYGLHAADSWSELRGSGYSSGKALAGWYSALIGSGARPAYTLYLQATSAGVRGARYGASARRSLLLAAACAYALLLAAALRKDPLRAGVLLLFLFTLPTFQFYGRSLLPFGLELLPLFGSILLWESASARAEARGRLAGAGLLMGLAALIHPMYLLLIPAAAAAEGGYSRSPRRAAWLAVPALVPIFVFEGAWILGKIYLRNFEMPISYFQFLFFFSRAMSEQTLRDILPSLRPLRCIWETGDWVFLLASALLLPPRTWLRRSAVAGAILLVHSVRPNGYFSHHYLWPFFAVVLAQWGVADAPKRFPHWRWAVLLLPLLVAPSSFAFRRSELHFSQVLAAMPSDGIVATNLPMTANPVPERLRSMHSLYIGIDEIPLQKEIEGIPFFLQMPIPGHPAVLARSGFTQEVAILPSQTSVRWVSWMVANDATEVAEIQADSRLHHVRLLRNPRVAIDRSPSTAAGGPSRGDTSTP